MKFSNVVLASILSAIVVAAPAPLEKRADQIVTLVTTTRIPKNQFFADLFGAPTPTLAAPVAPTAPVAAAPVAQVPPAATQVVQVPPPPPAATTSDDSGSLLDDAKSLFDFLLGIGGSKPEAQPQAPVQVAPQVAPQAPVITIATVGTKASNSLGNALSRASSSVPVPDATGLVQAPPPPSLPTTLRISTYSGSFPIPLVPTGSGVPISGSAPGAAAAVGAKGITYSPYTKNHACKTAQEVADDVQLLSNFDIIRLYSTDCSGIENLLAAISPSQQLFLGIWNIDSASVQGGLSDIQTALQTSSRGWSAVHTVAIGNEQVNAGTASPSQIGSAIQTAKTWLKQNAPSYTGPVVSVDTLVAVVGNPELCGYSDYLAVNSHPYWDGGVSPSNSGPWLQNQIQNLRNVCGSSKKILITETGWPTKGQTFGKCVPSVANQVAALKSLVSSLGDQILAFTMYNDYWKDPGPYGVEQDWGIFGDPSV